MKSYQSMWNACAYPMRKHSTSIGNISKSYQLMWNACPNFGKIGQFWKVTNRCGMLAHRVCASIPHRLVTFHEPRNIFNICPHQLVTFENVTYWCVMLAHITFLYQIKLSKKSALTISYIDLANLDFNYYVWGLGTFTLIWAGSIHVNCRLIFSYNSRVHDPAL